jgi:FlaA1/EpsC-like NDP-sugar epimerase
VDRSRAFGRLRAQSGLQRKGIPLLGGPGRRGGRWRDRLAANLRHDTPLAAIDVCAVVPAYLGPLVLRFDGSVPDAYWRNFWSFMPLAAGIHLLSNLGFGLYGQMWRYASVQEARRVALAGLTGAVVIVGANVALGRPLPISVVGLGAVLSLLAFGSVRFQSRLLAFRRRTAPGEARRVLLVGAGDAGAMVLNDILHNPSLQL